MTMDDNRENLQSFVKSVKEDIPVLFPEELVETLLTVMKLPVFWPSARW
jgi:hypothetical protein